MMMATIFRALTVYHAFFFSTLYVLSNLSVILGSRYCFFHFIDEAFVVQEVEKSVICGFIAVSGKARCLTHTLTHCVTAFPLQVQWENNTLFTLNSIPLYLFKRKIKSCFVLYIFLSLCRMTFSFLEIQLRILLSLFFFEIVSIIIQLYQ